MSLISYLLLLLAMFASRALAWLPFHDDNTALFNHTFEATNSSFSKRTLPAFDKIRGVNLGSMFVFEPWMAWNEWNRIGCGPYKSEFDCVVGLGQDRANTAFQNHWNTWITQADIAQMKGYGINTIRIPLGYWLLETILYKDSEHFPHGAFPYLERVCEWAAQAGFYIILDLHGAPGAQQAQQAFSGQYAPSAGFYKPWQYDRANQFLAWITEVAHHWSSFRNVGMLMILNEPSQNSAETPGLLDQYYPGAYAAIRNREAAIGIPPAQQLHVQAMNTLWGAGNPETFLTNKYFMSYDDHRYTKWDTSVSVNKHSYIVDACHNNRLSNWPTIVGEFSLSVPDHIQWSSDWHPATNQGFYSHWFAAMTSTWETQTNGWIYWSWKSQLGDYRWSYQDAVAAGVIPSNAASINRGACLGF